MTVNMEDVQIIELFNLRDEAAILAVSEKYGAYCFSVANNILMNAQDSEECVNDTYVKAWNIIPPACPRFLRPFLAKITRNLALDRYRASVRIKRGGQETVLALEELGDVVSDEDGFDDREKREAIIASINAFLRSLPRRERDVFIRRYFYLESVKDISARYRISENHISTILFRTRKKLKYHLESEGYKI